MNHLVEHYFPDLTAEQYQQFSALEALYTHWNAQINVISRKDTAHFYERHVLHSLAIAKVCRFLPGATILDIGTGGGFPGIPLAILYPEVQFHLVDSIGKKIKVVEAIAQSIGLKNVRTLHTRTEEIKNEKFDFVVSRAVAPLRQLWKWSLPILKAKGQGTPAIAGDENIFGGLICLKGGNLTEEIKESGLHPLIWEIDQLFDLPYFKEKFILLAKR